MITSVIDTILEEARTSRWVTEPKTKELFSLAGMDVPRHLWTTDPDEARIFARKIGYPVVVKVVSSRIIHKSDAGGVVTGISDDGALREACDHMSRLDGFEGVLVEEMVTGIELIVGAKIDSQFGPVILCGMGGTTAEIYHDVSLRMAPIETAEGRAMLDGLKARRLLEGFRGSEAVDKEIVVAMLVRFSALVMEIQDRIESIDLNPVICSGHKATIADGRIILRQR